MNYLDADKLKTANTQAVYNLYLYLSDKIFPKQNETLISATGKLDSVKLSDYDTQRLNIIRRALTNNDIAYSKISEYTYSKKGLTACVFTSPGGDISVAFKGTGSGEWIDNGDGLSGIAGKNTYITYSDGKKTYETVEKDHATDQQVEALNWFRELCHKNAWDDSYKIIISGHSKGGNKAQFITIHSDIVKECYSFDGQGFSYEALSALRRQYGEEFEQRRQKIMSFSADNDFVNVLGARLMPQSNIYYFKSVPIFHPIENMMSKSGILNPQCSQGLLSDYAQTISEDIMALSPDKRRYVVRAVMNIFQKYLGDKPINQNFVSIEETITGIAIAVSYLLKYFKKA